MPEARPGARASIALALSAMAALIAACLIISARRYFWIDELFTYTLATDESYRHMLRALSAGVDGAPPLYPTLAWLWNRAFGASETSLRLFTALALCVGLGLTWRMLWKEYGARAAAVGTLVMFTASPLLLRQVAEARFYGLLVALTAAALLLFHIAARRPRGTPWLYAATALVHGALVLSHVFGGLYSAAILLALVAWDRVQGRFRPGWYAAVLVGWAAFLPWLPSFLAQSALFGGRSWIAVPDVWALLEMYRFRSPVLTVVALVLGWMLWRRRRSASPSVPAPAIVPLRERPLLFAAGALFLVPVVTFALSHVGPSIFLDRYFLPASLGWAILLAHAVCRLSRDGARSPIVGTDSALRWRTLYAALLLFPVAWAEVRETDSLAGAGMEGVPASVAGLPIVVEYSHDYLPAAHYARPEHRRAAARIARRRGEAPGHVGLWGRLLYPIDSAVALDERSPRAALTDMRLMAQRRAWYGDPGIVDAAAVLCGPERFLVLHREGYQWHELRLRADPRFSLDVVAHEPGLKLILVRRVASAARPVSRRRVEQPHQRDQEQPEDYHGEQHFPPRLACVASLLPAGPGRM